MATNPPTPPPSNVDGSSNFEYQPLDLTSKKPSIRLAVLLPGDGDSTIRVTLIHKAFADKPVYEALSYTWGSLGGSKEIELNGKTMQVGENLFSALFHLRSKTKERVLWVDAICINQSDTEERNHQVSLMAHIYSRAEEVIVWLGVVEDPGRTRTSVTLTVPEDMIPNLANRPYWNRVWIVQEISVATKLKVCCGGMLTTPGKMSRMASPVFTWESFFDKLREIQPTGNSLAVKLDTQREGRHGQSYELANLMEVCKGSLCSEPRDKVYGFLGVAHDCQDGSLSIDYSKTLFELYEEVIRFQYRSDSKKIVRLSQLAHDAFGGASQMHEDLKNIAPGKPNPLSAFSLADTSSLLKIPGYFCGRVSVIGPTYDDFIGDPNAARDWKVALSGLGLDIENLRRKNESFSRVLLHLDETNLARICPIDGGFAFPLGNLGGTTRLMMGLPVKHVKSKKKVSTWGTQVDDPVSLNFPEMDLPERDLPELTSPEVQPTSTEPHSRLFATSEGDIGLMPWNTQMGDFLF
ncbi:Heterokaryon incompatibility protein 6 OR allele [Lachnellula suecica]|uniref:Heterokaryon incompatibility protein 6 OR allele n=1 Tax=Lachnellula suecica TaxID=602035 RepID=A0A8T9C4B9_9HELO|nr:Heterokaryon incompatibility protein 6 OR allele [Lachnellula suecica]